MGIQDDLKVQIWGTEEASHTIALPIAMGTHCSNLLPNNTGLSELFAKTSKKLTTSRCQRMS